MSTESMPPPDEEEERGWRDRIAGVVGAWRSLVQTRLAILREESAQKLSLASKGLLAIVLASALAVGVLLLLAALLVALFAQLFGNLALGILATLVLFAAGAAIAGWLGWKALERVRPLEFSATTEELARDWQAVRASLSDEGAPREEPPGSIEREDEAVEDLQERVRLGAE